MSLRVVLCAAVLLGACAGSSSVRRCPEAPSVPCLTDEECSIDPERDCEVCRCAPPAFVPPEREDPLPSASPE